MSDLKLELPHLLRLTVEPHVKIDLHASFLIFIAYWPEEEGSAREGWSVSIKCWRPIDDKRQCWAWMTTLIEDAPVPSIGSEFGLYWGAEKIATAQLCDFQEEAKKAKASGQLPWLAIGPEKVEFKREHLGTWSPDAYQRGAKVLVKIKGSPTEGAWHADAVEELDDRVGEITDMHNLNEEPEYYVAFDAPARRWAMRSSDPEAENLIYGWHFNAGELRIIDAETYKRAQLYARASVLAGGPKKDDDV